jgi:hypothetical protein
MYHTRPIHPAAKRNFNTLLSAVEANRICLLSVYDTQDQQPAVLVCAVNHYPDESECFEFIPLARLCDGDPYTRFITPLQEETSS